MSFSGLILDQNDEIKRLRAELAEAKEQAMAFLEQWVKCDAELTAVRACFAEASQDNVIASARIAELEEEKLAGIRIISKLQTRLERAEGGN